MLHSIQSIRAESAIPLNGIVSSVDIFDEVYSDVRRKYFLFKQGVKRTNVAHIELISLLQIHIKGQFSGAIKEYQFISENEALELIEERLSISSECSESEWRRISDSISDYFKNRILIVAFDTSCAVFLPEGTDLDLAKITAESGYIHSCGDLVFNWNSQVIDENLTVSSLDRVLGILKHDERALLVPYCHEDFTSRDRDQSEFLKDGLDEVKVNIGKSYIGATPMHKFVYDYVKDRSDLVVSAPTNYKRSREQFTQVFPGKSMATIWIVADNRLGNEDGETLGQRYLISYLQRYKNDNPYHHYEENKPAWISHTTLPHSLAGAMVNLTRPWLPNQSPVICDPFCGSGTIYLEAQKFSNLRCHTSDQSPLAEKILQDNISFFQLDANALEEIIHDLESIDERSFSSVPKSFSPKKSKNRSISSILEVIDEWSSKTQGDFLQVPQAEVDSGFGRVGGNLTDRIVLYVALRANVRGEVTLVRGEGDWYDVFDRELKTLIMQMKNHLKTARNSSLNVGDLEVADGSYSSVTVTPRPYEERSDLFGSGFFELRSVEFLPRNSFDAVICDPPYGFNTDTDRWVAEEFSKMMIPAMLDSLKRVGQIVIASPRTSYSGRRIPLSLRSDYIARSILEYCSKTNRRCWKPAWVLPSGLSSFLQPPYYWKAEKTLSRRILHFWIRPA